MSGGKCPGGNVRGEMSGWNCPGELPGRNCPGGGGGPGVRKWPVTVFT